MAESLKSEQIRFNSQYSEWQVTPESAGVPTPLYVIVDAQGIFALTDIPPATARVVVVGGIPQADDLDTVGLPIYYRETPIVIKQFVIVDGAGIFALTDVPPATARVILAGGVPTADDSTTDGGLAFQTEGVEVGNVVIVP